jgi:hypothetical protein
MSASPRIRPLRGVARLVLARANEVGTPTDRPFTPRGQ